MLLKRWENITSGFEERPEDVLFLGLVLFTSYYGFGFANGFLSGTTFKSSAERKVFKDQYWELLRSKRLWDRHDHDAVENYFKTRAEIQSLRSQLPSGDQLGQEALKNKRALEKIIREKSIQLSQQAGRFQQGNSDCIKLIYSLHKMDELDERLGENLNALHKLTATIDRHKAKTLKAAAQEWIAGKGPYAIEDWMNDPKNQDLLRSEKVRPELETYHSIMKEVGEEITSAVPRYNALAEQRNQKLPRAKWFHFFNTNQDKKWYQFFNKAKDRTLPLYDYRQTETGWDSRNFETRDQHDPQTGRPTVSGQTVDRAHFARSAKAQCDLGYEQLTREVKEAQWKSSSTYAHRAQITKGTLAGIGGSMAYGYDWVFRQTHKKSVIEARNEAISQNEQVTAANKDIAGQMDAEEKGQNRLKPFFDAASKSFSAHASEIKDSMRLNITELPDSEAALAKLENQAKYAGSETTVQNSMKTALFLVLSRENFNSLERFIQLLKDEDEGTRHTTVQHFANKVVNEAINNLYSGVTTGPAVNLVDNAAVVKIVDDILKGLDKKEAGGKTLMDAPTLPVTPVPGVTSPLKSTTNTEPMATPDKQASTGGGGSTGVRASFAMGDLDPTSTLTPRYDLFPKSGSTP